MAESKSAADGSELKRAMKKLEDVLTREFEATSAVLRQGDKLIIPEWMSYPDASRAIMAHAEQMEAEVSTIAEFDCHPNDGLVAFYSAVKDSFGALLGSESGSFFGTIPGKTLSIPIDYDEQMVVPTGSCEIPGVPIKLEIKPTFDEKLVNGGSLTVKFSYRRKYEPLCKRIEEKAREYLKTKSIFRGKAYDSSFQFINVKGFDARRVVYSDKEARQVEANILSPIKQTKQWRANGNPLKRGILLYGPYGTGKTLTALLTGKTCVQSGWTFINVLPTGDIVKMLKFAKKNQPACVFFEDVDAETSGKRTDRINEILNTIDGLLSKDSEVMVVLTTNHIENVNRAMLRPGRLDSIIRLGVMDEKSVLRMITQAAADAGGKTTIEGELDGPSIFKAAEGYVPAFITEAVTKAKAYALARNGHGNLKVTSADIVDALDELRPQYELMCSDQKVTGTDLEVAMAGVVRKAIKPLSEDVETIKEHVS